MTVTSLADHAACSVPPHLAPRLRCCCRRLEITGSGNATVTVAVVALGRYDSASGATLPGTYLQATWIRTWVGED
eukprot:152570-Chlamydomonas_euryale.AAC.2